MPRTFPHRFIRTTAATAFKRIAAATALLAALASPAAADYSGTWYFQGIGATGTGPSPTAVDAQSSVQIRLVQPGSEFSPEIRYRIQGTIDGAEFNVALRSFVDGGENHYGGSNTDDTDWTPNKLRRVDLYAIRIAYNPEYRTDVLGCIFERPPGDLISGRFFGILTRTPPSTQTNSSYQGKFWTSWHPDTSERVFPFSWGNQATPSNWSEMMPDPQSAGSWTFHHWNTAVRNPLRFTEGGSFLKAQNVFASDGVAINPVNQSPYTRGSFVRVYRIDPLRLVGVSLAWQDHPDWTDAYNRVQNATLATGTFAMLTKPGTIKTLPVPVHDVNRFGSISSQPIAAKVLFHKPGGQLVASGYSNVGGTITLDQGEVDMQAAYDITLEQLAPTVAEWPLIHRRHYANLIPAQIQAGQLALPVTLQNAIQDLLVARPTPPINRLAPLRTGGGYDLTGVWRLLTDWNPWQVQPLPLAEIRKRDESLARLHIALQQLADLYVKADELSIAMGKGVMASASAWQQLVEARAKIRVTGATSRFSGMRLWRKLHATCLDYIEDTFRNWVVDKVQGSLTARQADLFGKMLDAAIAARRAHFNSDNLKTRTDEANDAARDALISSVGVDVLAQLALHQYVQETRQALDDAVADSTNHYWTDRTSDGIERAVPLGAFLVDQIDKTLNGADFIGSTAGGWNEIADGLSSLTFGRMFFKISAGIRAITTVAQTATIVRMFFVHEHLDLEKVSKVTQSAYRDVEALPGQLTLAVVQPEEPSTHAMNPRDIRPRVFTGYATALNSLEESLPQDTAALMAEAESYVEDDGALDLDIQNQINRLRAAAAQATEPRPGLTLAIGTLVSRVRDLRDARIDLTLALLDEAESSSPGSSSSDAAISTAIGSIRTALDAVEQALAGARDEADGLAVPAVLCVERAWVPAESDNGTVAPGAIEIRARICNRGDAPSAAAWVKLEPADSYPGLHSITIPSLDLPVLQPGQSIEVSWSAGLGEAGKDNRGLLAGYSIRIGAGDTLQREFDGTIQAGNPPGIPGFVIDGVDDGFEGYLNRTIQTRPAGWGSGNVLSNLRSFQDGDRLNLLIGGCAQTSAVLLFIDSRSGGVNRITPGLASGTDAALINNLAIDGAIGLTFEPGFTADQVIRIAGTPEAAVHLADLRAPARITAIGNSGTSLTSGGIVAAIATSWNPVTADVSRYSRTTRGIEISLDLKALSLRPGEHRIKLFAMMVNASSDWGSNQTLPPRGADTDLGPGVRSVNFASEAGDQALAIDVLVEGEPPDTDGDGLPDAVETGTGRFTDASDTGTSPAVADSDGDGHWDGDEVAGRSFGQPTDPTIRDYPGMVVAGSFNLPQPWNPSLQGSVPDTTMKRIASGGLAAFYRWSLDYQFVSTGSIEYKFAAGSWYANWGAGGSPGEAKPGNEPNLRARIEATGIHRFHFDQAAGTQSFERVRFADAAAFLRAYGLAAGADADQDGVPNEIEFAANTDPTRADSDGDGTGDATDPVPLKPTRDVVFIADLWVQQSLGRFDPADGRVFVRFANGGLKGTPDLELLPTGEPGVYRGTLPQVTGMAGETLGGYHLVRTNRNLTSTVEESAAGSRTLVAETANRTQTFARVHFNNEIPPDGTATAFFGEDSFDDDNLGAIGSTQRWRYNIGAPAAVLANRNQRLSFTSTAAGTASAAWATPSTSGGSFDVPWSAAVNVTNTTTPTAGYTLTGLETQLAANFPSGPAISAYYGVYLLSHASWGRLLISECGLWNPSTLQWTRLSRSFGIDGLSTGRLQLSRAPGTNTITASASADGINFFRLQTFQLNGTHAPPGPPLSRGMGLTLVGMSSNAGALVADGRMSLDSLRVVPGPSAPGYAMWAASHAGGGNADADFDRDGVPNAVEYFMGETGTGRTLNPLPVNGDVAWPRDPEATDVIFRVQASDNLVDWTDVTSGADAGTPGWLRYRIARPHSKGFARLVITTP